MFTKLYKSTLMAAAGVSVSLLLFAVPVAAQAPSTGGSDQDQSQTGTDQSSNDQSSNESGQAGPSSTIEGAVGPFAGSVSIAPHSSQWYKFKYGYFPSSSDDSDDNDDNDNADSDRNSPSQAVVELKMDSAGCASFEVWTPDRLNAPEPTYTSDDKDQVVRTPVGAGSPVYRGVDQSRSHSAERTITDAKNLVWVGGAALNNTYYIQVRNRTDGACNYTLKVSGPDVAYQPPS